MTRIINVIHVFTSTVRIDVFFHILYISKTHARTFSTNTFMSLLRRMWRSRNLWRHKQNRHDLECVSANSV